ncbi:MAG: hypothetical protein Q7T11_00955, partial [Deltaproteobacteria bacterium]|nr:hypothetical protein [Deltaproteobacteria bacterium]
MDVKICPMACCHPEKGESQHSSAKDNCCNYQNNTPEQYGLISIPSNGNEEGILWGVISPFPDGYWVENNPHLQP